jgi:hypothetical protein
MQQILLSAAVTVLIALSLKFLFWINGKIFISLMGRSLGIDFWKFTPLEIALSCAAAASFSYSLIYQAARTMAPFIFIVSGVAYIGYMTVRVWSISKMKDEP